MLFRSLYRRLPIAWRAASRDLKKKLCHIREKVEIALKNAIIKIQNTVRMSKLTLKNIASRCIGPLEKGMEAATHTTPPNGTYDGVDLSTLPKYICYRAALQQKKLTIELLLVAVLSVFAFYFVVSRYEISTLYDKLLVRPVILAPGIRDFVVASPQKVEPQYVEQAVVEFLNKLGTVSADNIERQYKVLSEQMSTKLKMQFEIETQGLIRDFKRDNLTELLTILDLEIKDDQKGHYRAVAQVRVDLYIENEHADQREEIIEMDLALVPPSKDRRWYLEITSIRRESTDTFKRKRGSKQKT